MRQISTRPFACAVVALGVAVAVIDGAQRSQQPPQAQSREQKPGEQKPADPAAQKSAAKFAVSKDGTRIAYETIGTGPAVMLLHGAGQTRQDWQRVDYAKRLSAQFTAILVDLRGNGESDKPTRVDAYALDTLADDLLAVADAAKATRFHVWGFAYGGIVGSQLCAVSDRVQSFVYIGGSFGPPVTGVMRDAIAGFRSRWQPVMEAEQAGKLDLKTLPPGDAEAWQRGGVKLSLAWQSALMDYPAVEPSALKCPTLWVVGKEDGEAMASVKAYESKLAETKVMLALIDGLNHGDTLNKIDQVFQKELEFTQKTNTGS